MRVEIRGAGHVPREEKAVRANRGADMCPARRGDATRQVISLMQPRRIHSTKCMSLQREGVGGKKGGARREKKGNKIHGFPTR